MRRAATFEKMWRTVEAGLPVADVGGSAPEIAAELEMARALRALGASIEAPAAVGAWASLEGRIDDAIGTEGRVSHLHPRTPAHAVRAVLAVAAAFAVLVAASLRADPGSPLYGLRRDAEQVALALSPSDTSLHLRLAGARLDDLVVTLSEGDYQRAPAAADSLATERRAALTGGADVATLDGRIRSEVPPALAGAPAATVRAVDDALTGVLPDATDGSGVGPNGHHSGGGGGGLSSGSGDRDGRSGSGSDGSTGSGDRPGSGGTPGSGDSQGSGGSQGSGDSQGSGGSQGSGDSQGSGGSGSNDQSGSVSGSGSTGSAAENGS